MKNIFMISLILVLPFLAHAQEAGKPAKIVSPIDNFSARVPADFLVDNENGKYRVYVYRNEFTAKIEIEKDETAKKRLGWSRKSSFKPDGKDTRIAIGDFIGDIYVYDKEAFRATIYAASSKAFYTIVITAKDKNDPALKDLLYSIALDGQKILKQTTTGDEKNETGISLDSLKTSAVVLEALKRKDAERTKYIDDYNAKEITEENDLTKYSRPLIVLRKPQARYTDAARANNIQGKVKLNIVFRADGRIGDITVVRKLSDGLTDEAVNAARRIKFVPAEIDRKAVDTTRTLYYSFTIY